MDKVCGVFLPSQRGPHWSQVLWRLSFFDQSRPYSSRKTGLFQWNPKLDTKPNPPPTRKPLQPNAALEFHTNQTNCSYDAFCFFNRNAACTAYPRRRYVVIQTSVKRVVGWRRYSSCKLRKK